jgi:RHH-type proline utilization regulon transcriptional repressor/proline dehydrogenase/delta 1-pyrroline-5-carboxylate dehydrogenase
VPVSEILKCPQAWIADASHARHPRIPLPRDLYGTRKNSAGVEFGDRASLEALLAGVKGATPLKQAKGDSVAATLAGAARGFTAWNATPVSERAVALERVADLYERNRNALIALLQSEGGKTLDDALAEVREAVDFCRYYASEARRTLVPERMPGPTGETNELHHRGRGVFVCISPWNFPLAIFTGQIAAALVAGNAVIAKPAEQTPQMGAAAIALMHAAGIPADALHLVLGDGKAGAALVADPRVAGVAFTGSTEVARAINRSLAGKDGPIVPLIAETGGINAMIVDATALPEQVTDDVITSAFRSAGQRCSALRLLCVQEDVADRMLEMIEGAARALVVGDPREIETHVGPVIDADAKGKLDKWVEAHASRVRFRHDGAPTSGLYVAPTIIALERARDLNEEVFGPVLHVVRWRADKLDALIDDIAGNGYGLTLGIHSRIDETAAHIVERLANGNVYVNRNMIGAVVGTQPFGGSGLSGTGPKAGGPNYLRRFATEQTVTVNTAAAGGNASLLSEGE